MADGVNYSLKGFDQYELLLGDELRGERATINKSLLDVQKDLKIKASYIAAIENCDLKVFSNQGFIAGYVRSYARYLGLDPTIVYERFCREAGFSGMNAGFTLEIKKPAKASSKYFGSDSSWQPGNIGRSTSNDPTIFESLLNFAPVLLVAFVWLGTFFGAVHVLKEVQKLEVVALDESPDIFSESPAGFINSSLLESGADIYSSKELALPVFEPRDRAVSTLEPSILTALENKKSLVPFSYSLTINGQANAVEERSFGLSDGSFVRSSSPVVRTFPNVPNLKILAMTPAWVRIKNQMGDVVFEKILKQRETYTIEKNQFKGRLRAGNAQNVYFVIDNQIFGPLSLDKSVVKNVSLDPEAIQSNLIVATSVNEMFWSENQNPVFANTAGVVD